MIKLDLDLIYLSQNYGISQQVLKEMSGNSSVVAIMGEESNNGNTKASTFKSDIISNPDRLIEAFKLSDALNRYMILSNMNSSDIALFLLVMEPEDLAVGLKFFHKDKILYLLSSLPQDRILEILKRVYSMKEITKLISEKELNAFLMSKKLDDEEIMQYLDSLPQEALEQIMQGLLILQGEGNQNEKSGNSDQSLFRKSLLFMDKEYKAQLAQIMLEQSDKAVNCFSKAGLVEPLAYLPKAQIVKAVGEALEAEEIVKLIYELPQDLLAMVATQLDPKDFSDILVNKFPDVLAQISL